MRIPRRSHNDRVVRTSLSELRQSHGASQQDLADLLGTTQPAVLKLERSADPQLSSVRRYVEAVGRRAGSSATLEVHAVVGDSRFVLQLPTPKESDLIMTPTQAPADVHAVACWRLRAWDDIDLEQRFLTEDLIAISGDEIGDVADWPTDAELRTRLRGVAAFANKTEQAIGLFVSYWTAFRIEMQPGDTVVVPLSSRRAAIGVIEGPYEYRGGERDTKMRHVRRVRWVKVVPRSELDEAIRKVVNAPGTICRIQAPDAARGLIG